jgi:hypothetical protein
MRSIIAAFRESVPAVHRDLIAGECGRSAPL